MGMTVGATAVELVAVELGHEPLGCPEVVDPVLVADDRQWHLGLGEAPASPDEDVDELVLEPRVARRAGDQPVDQLLQTHHPGHARVGDDAKLRCQRVKIDERSASQVLQDPGEVFRAQPARQVEQRPTRRRGGQSLVDHHVSRAEVAADVDATDRDLGDGGAMGDHHLYRSWHDVGKPPTHRGGGVRERSAVTGLPERRPVPLVQVEPAGTHGEHLGSDRMHDAVPAQPSHHLGREAESVELRSSDQPRLSACQLHHRAVNRNHLPIFSRGGDNEPGVLPELW